MPNSNFPNGFQNGVVIQGVPILNTYGGNVFWVDSGAGSDGNPGTFKRPFSTLDYAVGRCTASNGDIIFLKPGHVETVTAAGGLDLDVAGITVVFLGSGTNKAYVTFTTAVTADMDVDAANVTLINPKFIAGVDALTGPIDVNSTDFTMVNGEWHDAAGIETTDCIIATSGATRLCIDGWKFFKSDEAGTQKESHIQLNGVDDCILRNLHVEGDFDTAIIENVTDEVLRITMEDHFLKNTDPGNAPCASLDSAASGWGRRLDWRNANGTVVSDVADVNWSSDALGYSTDGYGGDPIGTALAGGLEGKVDAILADTITVSGGTLPANPTANSLAAYIASGGTALGQELPDSMSLIDLIGDYTGAHDGAAQDDNIKASMDLAHTDLDAILADTVTISGGTLPAAPTAGSLATYISGGSTALGQPLPASMSLVDIIGNYTGAYNGAAQDDNIKASLDLAHTDLDAILLDTGTTLPATLAATPQCVVKADGACLNGLDPLFTIAGGPVRCKIVGLVTTVIGANVANFRLQHITDTPAATVELNAGAVAVTDDAAGTFYYNVGNTSVFTPSAGLGFVLADPVTLEETEFLLAPGTVQCLGSAANTGVIAWYMTYTPLSPLSTVTAAA